MSGERGCWQHAIALERSRSWLSTQQQAAANVGSGMACSATVTGDKASPATPHAESKSQSPNFRQAGLPGAAAASHLVLLNQAWAGAMLDLDHLDLAIILLQWSGGKGRQRRCGEPWRRLQRGGSAPLRGRRCLQWPLSRALPCPALPPPCQRAQPVIQRWVS